MRGRLLDAWGEPTYDAALAFCLLPTFLTLWKLSTVRSADETAHLYLSSTFINLISYPTAFSVNVYLAQHAVNLVPGPCCSGPTLAPALHYLPLSLQTHEADSIKTKKRQMSTPSSRRDDVRKVFRELKHTPKSTTRKQHPL